MRGALTMVLLSMGAGCTRPSAAAVSTPPPGEVWLAATQVVESRIATAAVAMQDVGTEIVTTGRVVFQDALVSHVFSPVTGRVTKIDAQLGQRVKKGDALAHIDSPDVGVASAEFDKAHADLVAAEHDLRRQKELFEVHAAPQRDVETAEDNYLKAKAELERAQQKARLLRTGSGDVVTQGYVVRAGLDGEVVAKNISPGMEVQGQYAGGNSVELFTIGELDPVWVLADVFEMDLPRVKSGQHVTVKAVSYPNETFEGTLDWISGTLDPTSRTAKARCSIPNTNRLLRPEMYASVTLRVEGRPALAVPRGAVLRLGDQSVVFVDLGSRADGLHRYERRVVSVNEDEPGAMVPVAHGVEPGEQVVTDGAILLSEML